MGWEQRLREMVLAGGALATTACGASTATSSDAAADGMSNVGDDASDDTGNVSSFCCNASSDPCCYTTCNIGPDAESYTACREKLMDCGVNETFQELTDGRMGCFPPPVVTSFCCNANPDPCCPIGYCRDDAGPDASDYISCEQDRSECEALDGSYTQVLGVIGCSVSLDAGDAGPTDAAPGDGGPSDAGPGDAEAGP